MTLTEIPVMFLDDSICLVIHRGFAVPMTYIIFGMNIPDGPFRFLGLPLVHVSSDTQLPGYGAFYCPS